MKKGSRSNFHTPPQQPKIILRYYQIEQGAPETAGLVYWDWMDKLSPGAASAEWAAGHWTVYQASTYYKRHQEAVNEFHAFLDRIDCILRQCNDETPPINMFPGTQ